MRLRDADILAKEWHGSEENPGRRWRLLEGVHRQGACATWPCVLLFETEQRSASGWEPVAPGIREKHELARYIDLVKAASESTEDILAHSQAPIDARERGLTPVVLEQTHAAFPPIAMSARLTGSVAVTVMVDEKGRVEEAFVTRSQPPFDQVVVESLKSWRYQPLLVGEERVPFLIEVKEDFGFLDTTDVRIGP